MRFGSGSSKKVSIIVKGILDICSLVLLHCRFLSLLNGHLPFRYIGLPKKKSFLYYVSFSQHLNQIFC